MDRGLPWILVVGVVAVVVAGGPVSTSLPDSAPVPTALGVDAPSEGSMDSSGYGKGRELLEAFWGNRLPEFSSTMDETGSSPVQEPGLGISGGAERRVLSGAHRPLLDFDVLIASMPDPYESRMDWIYDALLAAVQRAFETGGFVLDRYWIPNPDSALSVEVGGNTDVWPVRRVHPGVLLFRSWNPQENRLRLRLVYLVGEGPTKGAHIPALKNALRERRDLLSRIPSASPDSTRTRRQTIRILGPVFSGSSYSYRRVLDDWLSGPSGETTVGPPAVRLISGSATSPANKATLEGSPFDISFSATVNSDEVLMSALAPMALDPLGIRPREVAILQEYTTAYGQSLASPTAQGSEEGALDQAGAGSSEAGTPLVIPFPMSISLLRSEYARLPTLEKPVELIPEITQGPRVPLSLREGARTPETPASVSGLTAPTLDIVMEEITRVLEARGIRAVGLMATDVRDKLFLGDQIKRRLPDVQLFTLESNVLLRAPEYRNPLRGMLILSTYPLFLENQERIPGEGRDDLLSFSNDGAQGAYNAALLHLGLDSLAVGYGAPEAACVDLVRDGGKEDSSEDPDTGGRGLPTRRPPVWLSAVGNNALLPISCGIPSDESGYLAEIRGLSGGNRKNHPPRRGMLVRGGFLLLVLATYLVSLVVLWDGIGTRAKRKKAIRPANGDGEDRRRDDDWDVQEASHLIHLGIYRGALLIGLGGLAIPLGFPPGHSGSFWAVVIPALITVLLVASQTIRLTAQWADRGLRLAFSGLLETWPLLRAQRKRKTTKTVSDPEKSPWEGPTWALEIIARSMVAAAAIALAIFLGRYAYEMARMETLAPGAFDLFVQRAAQWRSGVSPLLPLTLGLLGVVGWCAWHWVRIEILFKVRPFEDSCFPCDDAVGHGKAGEEVPPAWSTAWNKVDEGVSKLRRRLFMLIPDPRALAFAVFMAFSGGWLLRGMGATLEQGALNPAEAGFGAWPYLLKGFVLSAVLITAWSIYRFASVWSALNRIMSSVLETPLVPAFHRMPRRVARLTRLMASERSARPMLASMGSAQWRRLQRIFELAKEKPGALDDLPGDVKEEIEHLMQIRQKDLFLNPDRSEEDGEVLARLRRVLTALWCHEPTENTIDAVEKALSGGADSISLNTAREIRTTLPSRFGLWQREAEELMATQIVGYVGWALSQVRWLALFLLFSLLFTTALVSSYPYQNQGEAKVFFFFVALAGILTLSATMVQMNRSDLLSRINGSDPNRLTWNSRLVVNLLIFGGLPLLAVLSSAFPPLRNVLTAWMGPVMGMLTSF